MSNRYNTGNSRPSNSMKDLNDNALAYDDFMLSEEGTFVDRLGNQVPTLKGLSEIMSQAGESVVEKTRQNLIPLSRQYMTLAAQADIANIPAGSTTYYRSPDDSALAIEVINNGGTLEATGRNMPSQASVDQNRNMIKTEISARTEVISKISSNKYLAVIPDANGREAWGIDAQNGAPTDHTISVWMGKMSESKSLPEVRNIAGYALLFSMLDASGNERMSELAINENGQFPGWVMQRWAARMAPILETILDISAQRPTQAGTWKHPSGDYVPYDIDLRTIVGLGSSSTNRSNANYTAMAADFGASYINMGDEGATIRQNMAQIGSAPALLTVSGGSIPASGSVNVTASNMPLNSNMNAFHGALLGIPGILAWSTGTTGTFTRDISGDAVSVPVNTPFIPDAIKYRANCIILESGKNDINTGRAAADILADTVNMSTWFAPFVPVTIVMGHFANGSYTTVQRNTLSALNAGITATFGNRAIDQQAWLTSPQLWVDLAHEGITPTSQDLADQAAGNVPQTLMISARDHLTTAAYGYRMKYLVKPKLIELGLYK
ncbi:TPA: hypothetical protein ACGW1T_000334 [Raoultella ornithinolytica]